MEKKEQVLGYLNKRIGRIKEQLDSAVKSEDYAKVEKESTRLELLKEIKLDIGVIYYKDFWKS